MHSTIKRLLSCIFILALALTSIQAQETTHSWTADEGLDGTEIRIPNDGDGAVEIVELAGKNAVRNQDTGALYIYCDVPDTFDASHVWVTVEYLDLGTSQLSLHYDSQQEPGADIWESYQTSERGVGVFLGDTGKWRTATFELKEAQFSNRENHGADLRVVAHGTIPVHSIRVSDTQDAIFWSAVETINGDDFRVLNAGDGLISFASVASRPAIENEGDDSNYFYFDAPDTFDSSLVYVVAEMYDVGAGDYSLQYDSYQPPGEDDLMTKYRGADESYGSLRFATGKWKLVAYVLTQAQFLNRQNGLCDFRISTGGTGALHSVRIYDHKPDFFDALVEDLSNIEPIVTIPQGMEVTVGGRDNFDLTQTDSWANGLKSYLANFKALGYTSHETYVIWRCIETAKGQWDWSHYDAAVEAHEQTGMKWVPFIILGPSYTIPDWYFHSSEHEGYVCLEHNTETDIMSLWAPDTRVHVEEFITEFARHYKDNPIIESVLLGVTGNYGESIYPVSSGGEDSWTSNQNGVYHSHQGMWCGDPYARADFQQWLEDKYVTIAALNTAWGTSHTAFSTAAPRGSAGGLNNRHWLDTVDWYRASMIEWSELWISLVTEKMPGVPVYLCTGGHAPPQHGSEFGTQSKLAAQYGAGVRITNEGDFYINNFAVTRWVASASRFYGGFFGFEPAGFVDYRGVVARIFNSTASGARQLHSYDNNIIGTEERTEKWKAYAHHLKSRQPIIRVAVWYPNRAMDLSEDVLNPIREIRKICDYDFMDNRMIRDGALAQYDVLVGFSDGPYEQDVLETVTQWVNGGGMLLAKDFPVSGVLSVEGSDATYQSWKTNANVELLSYSNFYNELRGELANQGILMTGVNGLYVAGFTDGALLYFNNNDTPVQIPGTAITVPANALYETPPDNEVWGDFNKYGEQP